LEIKTLALLETLGFDPEHRHSKDPNILLAVFLRCENIISRLQDWQKEIREEMFQVVTEQGVEDSKGSYTIQLDNGGWYKKEARTTVKVNLEKAEALGAQKGLSLVADKPSIKKGFEDDAARIVAAVDPKVVEWNKAVDDRLIETLYAEGKLSDEDLGSILERSVNYALKKGGV